jgi:hypothetical protein
MRSEVGRECTASTLSHPCCGEQYVMILALSSLTESQSCPSNETLASLSRASLELICDLHSWFL